MRNQKKQTKNQIIIKKKVLILFVTKKKELRIKNNKLEKDEIINCKKEIEKRNENKNRNNAEKDNKRNKIGKLDSDLNESKKESELKNIIIGQEDDENNGNLDNQDSLLTNADNQNEKNSQKNLEVKDINLHFPLQNKLVDNEKVINLKSDKELQDTFNAKNLEYYSQMEHIKMAVRYPFTSKNVIEGYIPGNCSGQSSGRIGGMHLLLNNKILIIYSRIECDNNFGKKNNVSEMDLLSFDYDLNIEKKITFRNGDKINCIKNARYGKNIFVMITESTKITEDKRYICDKYSFFQEDIDEDHLSFNCFLINEEEYLISDLISFNFNFFSPNDDLETLKDGSVVWTFIDN